MIYWLSKIKWTGTDKQEEDVQNAFYFYPPTPGAPRRVSSRGKAAGEANGRRTQFSPAHPKRAGTRSFPMGTLRMLTSRERSWRSFSTSSRELGGGAEERQNNSVNVVPECEDHNADEEQQADLLGNFALPLA